ncbi:MAG: hypothetical protein LQ340_000634 [Diploschistes diacapsis]|nr:MAG: hypothetical protein LQ340_000634 [Diploschistes diacapsis]
MESIRMALFIVLILAFILYYLFPRYRSLHFDSHAKGQTPSDPKRKSRVDTKSVERIHSFKDMYYKVQNLEDFPEVLPAAKQLLLSLLEQGLLMARYKSRARSILDMEEYDPVALDRFLEAERQDVSDEFESYVRRREAGSGPELFKTREEASQWLKRSAPLNYIDGAWLCRIHKITTPFALRRVTKNAWQTFSEELGDGDLEKNHVLIYRDLLRHVGVVLPDGDTVDFIHPRHGMDDEQVWRSAIGQLLISLFPNDFLPEILGLNLHFESLAVTGLKATKELPEFGISAYYYALHISIDNADSGHSAMALATIIQFMDLIRETGMMDYQKTWRRIQAGYLLSQSLDDTETVHLYEEKVIEMLHKKANLARKIHCTSRARIGQRSLTDWFSSPWSNGNNDDDEDDNWKRQFLVALADSKPWVYRGDSSKSLIMRELSWKGRMFGAFTHSEVELMRTWIDSLNKTDADPKEAYWELVGGYENVEKTFTPPRQDVAVTHPVLPPQQEWCRSEVHSFIPQAPIQLSQVRLDALLPLWFVHPCLLESAVTSTYRTATSLTSRILQILRAELGYKPENSGIAGMDEQLRPSYSPDLVALGLEIVRRHKLPEPTCLGDVIGEPNENATDASKFSYSLLSWAMRPTKNGAFLLGLARAFLDLEVWVASSDALLGKKEREALRQIIERKAVGFEACLAELKTDESGCREFVGGYECGRTEIEKLLE